MRVLTIDTNQPPPSTPCARNAPGTHNAECGMRNAEFRRRSNSCGRPPRMSISLPFLVLGMPEWGQPKCPQVGAGKSDLTARSNRAVIKIDSLSSVKQAGRV
jgi:hypothetical protein